MQTTTERVQADDPTSASITQAGRVFLFDRGARATELAEIAVAVAALIDGPKNR